MSAPTSSSSSPSEGVWRSIVPYLGPPFAASAGIVPAFYDMIAKSEMQIGRPAPRMTFKNLLQGVKGGFGAAPTVGIMVGTQMVLQARVEQSLLNTFPNLFADGSNEAKAWLTLASSAVVGGLSSPCLAVYNGKTMLPPWSVKKSLSRLSPKQAGAITLQETGFVGGLATADLLSRKMTQLVGDNKAVEYSAAAVAGILGSLFGHAGNTALTRWQNGMRIDNLGQLSWGSLRKARGNAIFAVVYKFVKAGLNSTVEGEK
jgi:hypothetical protein